MDKQKKELELYIHIPFCVKKCNYCDFLSAPADAETKAAYMEALCREITEKSREFRTYEVVTVFIGGGTPTTVPAREIKRMLDIIRKYYDVQTEAEISMEVNPGTVNAEALQIYKLSGINRLSIGLQSTEETELKCLGRIHSYEQFLETYRQARDAGFDNINVDIMSALPEQTMESYQKTLKRITGLVPPPEHISAYSLIIEEGTPFFEAYEADILNLPEEDMERSMYELTRQILQECGYKRYEISNYAQKGRECRHNIGYWERKNYLGFGIGAASLIENERFHNTSDLNKYLQDTREVTEDHQKLSVAEQMEETMFSGLRKTTGVGLEQFEKNFGIPLLQVYGEVVEKHRKEGLLEFVENEDGNRSIALTLKGMDVSNYVMADFLEPTFFAT